MSERLEYETAVTNAVRWRSAWIPALLLAVACGTDGLKPQPLTEPVETFWELDLDHHAVTLSLTAPYNTIGLMATPRNYKGESLSGLPAPVYSSSDPELVTVTPTGTVTAVQPTGPGLVVVYATLSVGNLTHRDSALVRVVDDPDPPVLTTFSIQPIPPDSAKSAATPGFTIPFNAHAGNLNTLVRATDADGNPIPDLLVDFRSSAQATARVVWNGIEPVPQLSGTRPGTVKLYASVTAFGVSKVDTLLYRIGWPLKSGFLIQPAGQDSSVPVLGSRQVTIGTGGDVIWRNQTKGAIEITFSDPANVAPFGTSTWYPPEKLAEYCADYLFLSGPDGDCTKGGNFVVPAPTKFPYSAVVRVFPVPGIYEFYTATGDTGRVVVVDER